MVTYSDLIQFSIFIVALVVFVMRFSRVKKIAAITANNDGCCIIA